MTPEDSANLQRIADNTDTIKAVAMLVATLCIAGIAVAALIAAQ